MLSAIQMRPNRKWKKIVYLFFATIICLLTAGPIFGWSSLVLVWKSEVGRGCTGSIGLTRVDRPSTMANNFFVPVAGVLLDWQGPRRTFFIGTFVFSLGALLFGLSRAGSDGIGVDLHVLGAVLITTGGPLCFLSNIALSEMWHEKLPTIISMFNVAFDASLVVLVVCYLLYAYVGLSSSSFFLIFSGIFFPLFIYALVWPRGVGKNSGVSVDDSSVGKATNQPTQDEIEAALSRLPTDFVPLEATAVDSVLDQEAIAERARKGIFIEGEETRDVIELDEVDLQDRSVPDTKVSAAGTDAEDNHDGGAKHVALFDHLDFYTQVKSMEFIFATVYHCVCLLWILAYLGTVETRLMSIAPDRSEEVIWAVVVKLVNAFGWILPSCFLASPLVGWTIERFGMQVSFLVTHVIGLIWSISQAIPSLWFQIATFISFGLYRAYYFSIFFVYVHRIFGFASFGRIWGALSFASGVVALLQYPILDTTLGALEGNFSVIFFVQLGTTILLSSFPLYLWAKRHYHNQPAHIETKNIGSVPNSMTTETERRKNTPIP